MNVSLPRRATIAPWGLKGQIKFCRIPPIIVAEQSIFEPPGSLTKLDLDYNKLQHINGPWFSEENQLKNRALSHHNISQLLRNDFDNLASLRTLVMSRRKLALIEDGAFTPLRTLEILDLSDNRLTTFDSSRLVHSTPDRLEMFRLLSNRISELFIDTQQLIGQVTDFRLRK